VLFGTCLGAGTRNVGPGGGRASPPRRIRADVVGPVCESGDFLAVNRDMVEPAGGALLAVMSAGAYGAVQAGTYNTRALVPEVLVNGAEWALVRPRLEVDQLIAVDRVPKWLLMHKYTRAAQVRAC